MTNEEHPFKKQVRKTGSFKLPDLPNPIPAEITDVGDVQKFFQQNTYFVPYAGTNQKSGHSLLGFLKTLSTLSETQSACIDAFKLYGFGGEIDIINRYDPIFAQVYESVTDAERKTFIDFIKTIDFGEDIRLFGEAVLNGYKADGNSFAELILSDVAGDKKSKVVLHDSETVLYVATTNNMPTVLAVSNKWDTEYLKENPPKLLPKYPYYEQFPDGTWRTMFHLKNGGKWYGRPDSIGSILYQYREFQDVSYLMKTSANNFSGQVLIEIEADDPNYSSNDDDYFSSMAERVEDNFSAKSDDPMTVFMMERPFGSSQAFVVQFKPNTNENFYTSMADLNERKIIRSHKLSRRLLGDSDASGLSANVFMDELKIRLPVFDYYQNRIGMFVNTIIHEVADFVGMPEFKEKMIKYQSPYKTITEDVDDSDNGGSDTE